MNIKGYLLVGHIQNVLKNYKCNLHNMKLCASSLLFPHTEHFIQIYKLMESMFLITTKLNINYNN